MGGDLRLRDLEGCMALAALVTEAELLYDEYFHSELLEDVRSWEGSQVGFLIKAHPRSAPRPKDASVGEYGELLGLIIYKFWGPPLRTLSVARVAVPQKYRMQGYGRQLMRWVVDKAKQKPRSECTNISLCAMPEAIPFYERLRFTPIPQE